MKTYIAAVGFEVDRIVLPAIKNKADRVWLLTHNGLEKDKGDVFVRCIKEKFSNAGIDCQQSTADRTDLFDILKEQKQEAEGMKDNILLPEYKIEIPHERLIRCLDIINRQRDNKISKRELKDLALGNNLIHISNKQDTEDYTDQDAYMALNKNLIDPLLEWKFITVNKEGGHHIVSVTDEG
ncbi:MAG: DUF6293 family protein [Nitrososphaeraceae archaeon]